VRLTSPQPLSTNGEGRFAARSCGFNQFAFSDKIELRKPYNRFVRIQKSNR
jgi:hypothetical protein